MGTWGFGILEDDAARDVYDDYIESVNAGVGFDSLVRALRARHADMLEDEDECPRFWLAIARAQWEYGVLSKQVLQRVKHMVDRGEDLAIWADTGISTAKRRDRVLKQFLAKLCSPNPRPRRPRKPVRRKPHFEAGDCLSIKLSDGDYGAAIVLAAPAESPGPGQETYGVNLIAQLRYKSRKPPTVDVFERREWLKLTHHSWGGKLNVVNCMALGFRKFKDRFEVICKSAIRKEDPKTSSSYSSWDFADQMIHQAKWERG